jgi:alanine dehydrogenase
VPVQDSRSVDDATLPMRLRSQQGISSVQDDQASCYLNVCHGHVTNRCVAQDLGYDYMPPQQLLRTDEDAENDSLVYADA